MISIYLDDVRPTPAGYVRTYTVQETIKLIEENNGEIEDISLDNDLGIGHDDGYEVLKWIEEEAFHGRLKPIEHIYIHTSNPAAQDKMMQARYNTYKYWRNQGYEIF